MNRREAISTVSLILGGTIAGAEVFLSGCSMPKEPDYTGLLNQNGSDFVPLLDEIAEVILPTTKNSPGAKAAQVGRFMNVMVTECYDGEHQSVFLEGLAKFDEAATELFGKNFMELDAREKLDVLLPLEAEIKTYADTKGPDDPPHYYQLVKQLTLVGFLTSEIGVKQAMRHTPIPGRFDPCIPYAEGEKAFS